MHNTSTDQYNASTKSSASPIVPRDFKGIWIPREIWLHPELSALEKLLWAEIHSLFDRERGGCYASNTYLHEFLGIKERHLQAMMAKLKELGLLIQVSFDGRQRLLKAILPTEDFSKEPTAPQRCTVLHPRGAEKCTSTLHSTAPPSYIYSKDKIKEECESSAETTTHSKTSKSKKAKEIIPKEAYREHVTLTTEQHKKLLDAYGIEQLDCMLDRLQSHKASKNVKYECDYATMCKGGWVLRAYDEDKAKRTPGCNATTNADGKSPRKIAEEAKQNMRSPFWDIHPESYQVTFVCTGGQAQPIALLYKDPNFEKLFSQLIKDKGFWVKKP